MSILNGGIQGQGILGFETILEYFEANIEIKNVVIIFISNDFKRLGTNAWNVDEPCYKNLQCTHHFYHFVKPEISDRELMKSADLRRNSVKRAFGTTF